LTKFVKIRHNERNRRVESVGWTDTRILII